MKLATTVSVILVATLMLVPAARAVPIVIDYEDLTEGPQGDPLTHQGVTYHDLNNVSGVFPDGSPFEPQPADEFIIENAGLFYQDFPSYGSPVNSLTFGTAFVPGENLTIGPLSTVTLDLDGVAVSASFDIGFYENGPWGGIEFHLDAIHEGQVVGSSSFAISDLGGRDNPAASSLSVSAPAFTQLHFYATYGDQYSMPRAIIDDLTIDYGEPTATETTTWGRVKNLYR